MTASGRLARCIALALIGMLVAVAPGSNAQGQSCATHAFEGTRHIVCALDPEASDLRLFWRDGDGAPYRGFTALARALEAEGHTLAFAINGGMYQRDFSPMGLYVEDGATLRAADTTVMEGPAREIPNFFKRPNGVFYLTADGAGIVETTAYLAAAPDAVFATQSGPMLVIGGQLHPALIPGSRDRTRRSGVGVCADGMVRFAISEDAVNFHDFARLFRDDLGCADALFLDGGQGAGIYLPSMRRNDWSWHGGYGPILGVVR